MTELLPLPTDLRQTPEAVVASAIYQLRIHGHVPFADSLGRRLLAWSNAKVASHSDDQARHERLEVLMATHNWPELEAQADTLLAANPADLYALGERGVALAMRRRRAEAERIVSQLGTGDHRWDGGQDKRAMLLILAALGENARAMGLLDWGEQTDNPPQYTLVGELMKGYPPFRQRYMGNP